MDIRLRYLSATHENFASNNKHAFAASFSLCIYKSNSIYSFIPKNACTTFRYSVALANGHIRSIDDFNWIHKNNEASQATLSDLARAKYSFTVLRCPFSRLASVFLDKIINKDRPAWRLYDLTKRSINLDNLSFSEFAALVTNGAFLRGDPHWRPQVDFLVYENYSAVYQFERLDICLDKLHSDIGFEVVDARPISLHATSGFQSEKTWRDYSSVTASELRTMRQIGYLPSHKELFNDDAVMMVKQAYADDVALYESFFGSSCLLF